LLRVESTAFVEGHLLTTDYFVLNRNVHSHITRGSNDLHVTVVNKNYGKKISNIKQPSFAMDYLIH